jgi:hypothetical protein
MNATERIVEQYFRLHHHCLTVSDLKIPSAEGRQIDLLVIKPSTKPGTPATYLHVEVSVTSTTHNPKLDKTLPKLFDHKFFGGPPLRRERVSKNTPDILRQLKSTYELYGAEWASVQRVWCLWKYNGAGVAKLQTDLAAAHAGVSADKFRVLSFRDEVMPKLAGALGTSHHEDELVRLASLYEAKAQEEKKLALKLAKQQAQAANKEFSSPVPEDPTASPFNFILP